MGKASGYSNGYMEGKMILSKPALKHGFKNESDKKNTAIHEFVHLIDMTDGSIDGIPSLLLEKQYSIPWIDLINKKIDEIYDGESDINPYGGTNRAEFFSVVSEYFFERPKLLERNHPELYDLLSNLTPGKVKSCQIKSNGSSTIIQVSSSILKFKTKQLTLVSLLAIKKEIEARELESIKNDELQKAAVDTINFTTPMPIIAEMRAIWDSIRPELEAVISGDTTPEAAAKAINDARRTVAEQVRDGAIGEANAQRDERINVSKANSNAVSGENEAKVMIANSDALRRTKEAEALRKATAAEKVQAANSLKESYEAEKLAEKERAEKERATREANEIVKAQIEKEKAIIAAEAQAEKVRLEAKGQADAIFLKMKAEADGINEILTKQAAGFSHLVKAAGGDADKAISLMIADKLEGIEKVIELACWSSKKWIPGMLRDKDAMVRVKASWALIQLERTDAIPDLEAAVMTETDNNIKIELEKNLKALKNILRKYVY